MSTFVSVGNAHQPFSRLLEQVERMTDVLPHPIIVQHGHTPFTSRNCEALSFVDMIEFEHLIVNASLVIMHAGGGGVLQAVLAGKVPVIVPRRSQFGEHIDDHQVDNANELAASGRVIVAHDLQLLGEAVKCALELQNGGQKVENDSSMLQLVSKTLAEYAKCLS